MTWPPRDLRQATDKSPRQPSIARVTPPSNQPPGDFDAFSYSKLVFRCIIDGLFHGSQSKPGHRKSGNVYCQMSRLM